MDKMYTSRMAGGQEAFAEVERVRSALVAPIDPRSPRKLAFALGVRPGHLSLTSWPKSAFLAP
ncbi:predicted protein [Streptomyces sp. AA4]|nr:predicted protein [Streptomyces sp. AA4]